MKRWLANQLIKIAAKLDKRILLEKNFDKPLKEGE